jgi:hypothetical protein
LLCWTLARAAHGVSFPGSCIASCTGYTSFPKQNPKQERSEHEVHFNTHEEVPKAESSLYVPCHPLCSPFKPYFKSQTVRRLKILQKQQLYWALWSKTLLS